MKTRIEEIAFTTGAGFLVTEDAVSWSFNHDTRAGLARELDLPDSVYVEMSPPFSDDTVDIMPSGSGDIVPDFSIDPDDWEFCVDDENLPAWWDSASVESRVRAALTAWIARKIITSDRATITSGNYYLLDGTVENMSGGTIEYAFGGTIQNLTDDGTIRVGCGTLVEKLNGGCIVDMEGGTIERFIGGYIDYMRNATIEVFSGGVVNELWDGAIIEDMRGGQVQQVWNDADGGPRIERLTGGKLHLMQGGNLPIKNGDATIE